MKISTKLSVSLSFLLLASCATGNPSKQGVIQTAKEIHRSILVVDAHADIVMPGAAGQYLGRDGKSKVSIEKLQAGGVGAVVMSVAIAPGPRSPAGDAEAKAYADEKIAAAQSLVLENPADAKMASTVSGMRRAQKEGKIAIILGFQNARALGGDIDVLNELYDRGVRVFGFNHIGHNDFSDSSRPVFDGNTGVYEQTEEHGGLSTLGRDAVKRINQLGGVLDVSQSSKAAALQIIKESKTPVIASHSGARTLSNVSRNLSDEEIDAIGRTGGVVHVAAFAAYLVDLSDPGLLQQIADVRADAKLPQAYAYPYELYWEIKDPAKKLEFLMAMRAVIGPGSVNRLVDHLDYVVDRTGIDHVGIGSDFNHGGGIDGFQEADEALNVTIELVRRGYSKSDIEKIWGGNFMRVLKAAETGKTAGAP